ncbi:acyl-CoA--6-aminopenicillanic acid acyl-transferase [Flavobacterium columnare]|uniref:Acyl-CoA--6-aminopenicillanic acid acyl-transferase n=1 Tax=Flavobacterium columnare TaxID=996 RepID=A0A437UD06_9FLAO|nr:C45 family autoproteolytic acyltransferase/hydolase [Flavobacterium columnare]RVU91502.1 acyl-CoA--6-aminopenicillanic acid acyl-transferase [Flavobacterium columnare]
MDKIGKYIGVLSMLILNACGISKSIHHLPLEIPMQQPVVSKISDTLVTHANGFLVKNDKKIWELHVSGSASERGMLTGALAEPLVKKQERIFFSKVAEMVPSKTKQWLLRNILKWYNRKLYLNVTEEFKTEIYGLSLYTDTKYNYIAPPFLRSLYLHGAHDIGHVMQDLALVGCTSLAVWGDKSADGELLIGRNLDFYAGDDFAQDKLITFVKPDKGIPYASVAWAGMIGILSGMNKEGLTVTINASKSKMPLLAKTPISLLTREILQYASTIEEAIAIAKKRPVFVSESIMIGSAKDKKGVIIEVSPKNFGVYEVPNTNQLLCTNHFQSKPYFSDKRNQAHIRESHSQYRMERMQELLQQQDKLNPEKMAGILRNKEGLKEAKIGYGNEKAINQLLAHHAVIFKPESRLMWVSSNPYQLGAFVAYDLNTVFDAKEPKLSEVTTLKMEADDFIQSEAFKNYEIFRKLDRDMDNALEKKENLSVDFITQYSQTNPNLWSVHFKLGKYWYTIKKYKEAAEAFQKAMQLEITTLPDRKEVEKYWHKTKKKLP